MRGVGRLPILRDVYKEICMAEITERGYILGSLQTLSPVLEQWLQINEREDWVEDGAPWWYNERTSLGIFAGAVWRCKGGWVLEEFLTEKRQKGQNPYLGRCDMAFGIGETEFWCEAKQCEVIINNDEEKAVKKVHKKLEEARQDVEKNIPSITEESEESFQGLMAIFVVPKVNVSKSNPQKIGTYIINFIKRLQQIEGVTLAWTFPKDKREIQPDDDIGYCYPGAVLVLKPLV
jgi:hypothetical protein